jgi:hypothetical protein
MRKIVATNKRVELQLCVFIKSPFSRRSTAHYVILLGSIGPRFLRDISEVVKERILLAMGSIGQHQSDCPDVIA